MIYEVTYKKNGQTWTSRVSFAYLCQLEQNSEIEIVSIS